MSNKKFSKGLTFLLSIIFLIVGFACGAFVGLYYDRSTNEIFKSDVVYGEGLEIHFLELGNNYSGDSIYIKCGETDILVDAGSRTNSSETITNYLNKQMPDDVLEFVIVTHADRDHIAAFAGDGTNASLFDNFEVETIIDFPKTNKVGSKETEILRDYYAKRDAEVASGAEHYTALECYNNQNGAKRSYEIGKNTTLNILYNYYYENTSSDENNYSVCFQIEEGDNKYLFTGDLEEKGEEYLVEYNELSKVKLFKAGHHGSKTSSNDVLLNIIQPEYCVVTCAAGSVEYAKVYLENTFPTQDFINRISKWTKNVYVTTYATIEENGIDAETGLTKYKDTGEYFSLNGNIVFKSLNGKFEVECSNSNTVLKDTAWFLENRQMPANWA